MNPSLERLEEMVRAAEARTRARKLEGETRSASESLQEAESAFREALAALHQERPALQQILDEAATDEGRLKELTKKITQLIAASAIDQTQRQTFMTQIESSRGEIEVRRQEAQNTLETLQKAASETRRKLQSEMAQYQNLRREMDRILPTLASEFQDEDKLAHSAEELFTSGAIRALAREVEAGSLHFGSLDRREQLAQLMIWIGKLKRLQSLDLTDVAEEDQENLRRVFPRFVGLSKQYEPGYIEAFRQHFTTDWDQYVARAEEQLRQATERSRLDRDVEHRRREYQAKEQQRQILAREAGDAALDDLRAVIASHHLPEEGVEEFQEVVARVIASLGAGDPNLLELISPYRDLVTGSDFRAVRKHLDRIRHEQEAEEGPDFSEYQDLLAMTRGRRALMIGGSAREDSRRSLQRVFGFEELDWENHEDKRPARLESIEQRIRNGGVDLVLILRDFVGHGVSERLRPASEEVGVPCLMVEHGYGPAKVAETLRRGLRTRGNGRRDDDDD
jgi:hypothetical protein